MGGLGEGGWDGWASADKEMKGCAGGWGGV